MALSRFQTSRSGQKCLMENGGETGSNQTDRRSVQKRRTMLVSSHKTGPGQEKCFSLIHRDDIIALIRFSRKNEWQRLVKEKGRIIMSDRKLVKKGLHIGCTAEKMRYGYCRDQS